MSVEGGDGAAEGGGDVADQQVVAVGDHLAAAGHDRGDVGGGGREHQVVDGVGGAGAGQAHRVEAGP